MSGNPFDEPRQSFCCRASVFVCKQIWEIILRVLINVASLVLFFYLVYVFLSEDANRFAADLFGLARAAIQAVQLFSMEFHAFAKTVAATSKCEGVLCQFFYWRS